MSKVQEAWRQLQDADNAYRQARADVDAAEAMARRLRDAVASSIADVHAAALEGAPMVTLKRSREEDQMVYLVRLTPARAFTVTLHTWDRAPRERSWKRGTGYEVGHAPSLGFQRKLLDVSTIPPEMADLAKWECQGWRDLKALAKEESR